ncbi:hypothetical protein D9758_002117 [Tetrapyrgos nigripes]|uniref:Major facilitator superfamily (MFS) profile domain-containing protein n=1 Tax=Tetrapyrgos nigripes TaxID=182062 RepID=A0A8H5GTC2_9AGAR|nr:hypothetical protein D9758_002117 [Tetrapyrgos nigripes]
MSDSSVDEKVSSEHRSNDALDLESVDPAVVLRKIDLVLIPMMMISNLLQFWDKSTISYANLMGIKVDAHLTGQQFSWLGSLFYFGYLAWQLPAAYLLQRLPIRWHLSVAIVAWGVILACHAACHDFASLAVCRFLLGVAESVNIPAFTLITGMYYKREEQTARVSLWFGTVGVSQILGGAVAWKLLQTDTGALNHWQTQFIIPGVITIAFGFLCFFIVPSSPSEAWFLTKAERVVAMQRISTNKTGTVSYTFEKYQLFEALKDPRLYCLALAILTAGIPNGGVSSFGAVIVKGFGFSSLDSLLLGMSTGGSEIVAVAAGYLIARITKTRIVPGLSMIAVAIVGAAMMIGDGVPRNAQFAGYCLVFWWPVAVIYLLSWMSSMISGQTKRIVFYIVYQVFYAAGNIIGSNIFRDSDAPKYIGAKTGMLIGFVFNGAGLALIAFCHWRWNNRRDSLLTDSEKQQAEKEEAHVEYMNKTDMEVKSFRWPY